MSICPSWREELRVEIEGLQFRLSDDEIKPGNLYVAERNTGPVLLECRKVDEENGYIVPISGYPFDIWECRKVIGIIE